MSVEAKVRTAVQTGHARFSFFCGLIGGVCASLSSVGVVLAGVFHLGPWWIPIVWFVGLAGICIGDWAKDKIPNRPAVITALLFPSAWIAMWSGACGQKFFACIEAGFRVAHSAANGVKTTTWIRHHLTASGDLRTAVTGGSIFFCAVALLYAWRYAKANSGSGANSAAARLANLRK